jgi:hypothetical protein
MSQLIFEMLRNPILSNINLYYLVITDQLARNFKSLSLTLIISLLTFKYIYYSRFTSVLVLATSAELCRRAYCYSTFPEREG